MTALLEARHVTKTFGGGLFNRTRTVALEDFSMAIEGDSPSITAVVGESGSGKTTLARLLLGAITPTAGSVLYKGQDLRKLSGNESRAFLKDVQVIFQDPFEVFNPFYRVDHVLTMPIDYMNLAPSREAKWNLIEQALETVGLRPEETLGRYPHQLSGGQRQRVMVARALLLNPSIIVADEPVSMVDASLRATILESLVKAHQELGVSLIYITHDLTTAYQVSQTILMLYQGSMVEVGNVDKVIKNPRHPYTQLLINSIPLPDPKKRWAKRGGREVIAKPPGGKNLGCKFAPRCPHVMPRCWESQPPLYGLDDDCAVACFLFDKSPVLDKSEIIKLYARR